MARKTFVADLMAEVISYGGLPVRRWDVYQDALKRTGSAKIADLYAFGVRTRLVDAVPLTLQELEELP